LNLQQAGNSTLACSFQIAWADVAIKQVRH